MFQGNFYKAERKQCRNALVALSSKTKYRSRSPHRRVLRVTNRNYSFFLESLEIIRDVIPNDFEYLSLRCFDSEFDCNFDTTYILVRRFDDIPCRIARNKIVIYPTGPRSSIDNGRL